MENEDVKVNQENIDEKSTKFVQSNKSNKGLTIFNVILFSIIVVAFCFVIYNLITPFILLIKNDLAGVVFGVIAFLPIAIILIGCEFILAIILTCTTKTKIKRNYQKGINKSKFDKVCLILPWIFLAVSIGLFVFFLMYANLNK